MKFAKLENNKLTYAPINYTTDTGSIITNFPNYLATMHNRGSYDRMYGFKLVEDIQPNYNPDTQYLTIDTYTETETKITIVYTINNFEVTQPQESLEEKVAKLTKENEFIKIELAETQSIVNELMLNQVRGI